MILKVVLTILAIGVGTVGALILRLAYSSLRGFKELIFRLVNNERKCRQKNIRDLRKEVDELRQEIGQIRLEIMEINEKK